MKIVEHSGGHLPFEGDITSVVHSDKPNTITVAANNTLSPTTVPPGWACMFMHLFVKVLSLSPPSPPPPPLSLSPPPPSPNPILCVNMDWHLPLIRTTE